MYHSPAFRIKLILLALAGLNALIFHRTIYRDVANWDPAAVAPSRARLAGMLSLIFWIAIIAAGRAIAYGPVMISDDVRCIFMGRGAVPGIRMVAAHFPGRNDPAFGNADRDA